MTTAQSPNELDWLQQPACAIDETAMAAATARQTQLTKPPGSLGQLEDIAIRLAGMGVVPQGLSTPHVAVFAADHGIAGGGVSAFPQVVTGEMVRNFATGGAAIAVLTRHIGAVLHVYNLGTVNDPGEIAGVERAIIAPSTADMRTQSAMTQAQLVKALDTGKQAVAKAHGMDADCFIGGDMGIGNTTAATAIACQLCQVSSSDLTGPGTGLDAEGVQRKAAIIDTVLQFHQPQLNSPLATLMHLGGFEIAALVGAYIHAAQLGMVTLVDGFIATSAALVASAINPASAQWMMLTHASAEPGHQIMVKQFANPPLLDLSMRLGEASGAAVALPMLRLAWHLHNEMATFSEAGVSTE